MAETVLKIEGMTCNHCRMSVENALKGVAGVDTVQVDLAKKEAIVTGEADHSALAKAVEDAGYQVVAL